MVLLRLPYSEASDDQDCISNMVGVAQLASASDCGSEGRGFESLYPPEEKPYPKARSLRIRFFNALDLEKFLLIYRAHAAGVRDPPPCAADGCFTDLP